MSVTAGIRKLAFVRQYLGDAGPLSAAELENAPLGVRRGVMSQLLSPVHATCGRVAAAAPNLPTPPDERVPNILVTTPGEKRAPVLESWRPLQG